MNDLNAKHALIAFGANLPFGGELPDQTILRAIDALHHRGVKTMLRSRLFKTPCFPRGAGPDYVNAAAVVEMPADMTPRALLGCLHEVEAQFGRRRDTRWGMRTLDLDLIAIGDAVHPDRAAQTRWRDLSPDDQARTAPDDLILPHPRLQDRAFVLVPLADIVPDWAHPLLGLTVRQMLDALPAQDRSEVVPFG